MRRWPKDVALQWNWLGSHVEGQHLDSFGNSPRSCAACKQNDIMARGQECLRNLAT
jgi:hypothetical protein